MFRNSTWYRNPINHKLNYCVQISSFTQQSWSLIGAIQAPSKTSSVDILTQAQDTDLTQGCCGPLQGGPALMFDEVEASWQMKMLLKYVWNPPS